MLYSDKLVEIDDDSILFRYYYFPFGSKRISLDTIKHIEILKPALKNGKYRLHGTGDFRTWYPCDVKRPSRDQIFLITFKKGWWRTGFTVERSGFVQLMFEKNGLVKNIDTALEESKG